MTTRAQGGRVSAERFWRHLCAVSSAQADKLVGYGAAWTRAMYGVLHRVQRDLELWCACEKPGKDHERTGECLEIDMMWFANDGDHYGLPLVAIEHENHWNQAEAMKDLWRVSMVCAPLRVFFGYAPNEKALQSRRIELVEVSKRCRRLPGGEDLIILRHHHMPLGKFVAWRVTDRTTKQLAEPA